MSSPETDPQDGSRPSYTPASPVKRALAWMGIRLYGHPGPAHHL